MAKNIGYRRVSTTHQETLRQLVNLPVKLDCVFEDKLSGKNKDRPSLHECIDTLEKGDTLWVHSIDRLARNVEDLRDIVFKVMDKGVTVKFVKEGLEFVSDMCDAMKAAMSKMLLTLLGAVAEFERSLIVSRVREGLAVAIAAGKKVGGASEKWRTAYQSNKMNHVSKSKHTEAMQSWEEKRPAIQGVINMMKKSKIKLTYKNIADNLQTFGVENASGKIQWSASSAHRALDYLDISR